MTTNGTLPQIDAWQAAAMRVTAFPNEVVPPDRLSAWWDDAVGFPPEALVSRPKAGQHQAQGEFEGRRLTLHLQPGRIDWRLNALVNKAVEEEPDLVLLGPFPEAVMSLSKIVAPWLSQAPEIGRLAFGAVLAQPVETVRAGYVLIQKYLPSVRLDPDGSSDFLYQINRFRNTTTRVEQLRVNRLMKWSVQVAQQVIVTLGEGGVATRTVGEEPACRLDLDINTAPDFGVLPAEQLGAILEELMELGREIAQKGDLP